MAWKRLTRRNRQYFVNVERVLYMSIVKDDEDTVTRLVFATHANASSTLELVVDQAPLEIVGAAI